MAVYAPCVRCDRVRAHVVVARVWGAESPLWRCPECGATLVPVRFATSTSTSPSPLDDAEETAPSPCPCPARGPVARAVSVLAPLMLLWVCVVCGRGRHAQRDPEC